MLKRNRSKLTPQVRIENESDDANMGNTGQLGPFFRDLARVFFFKIGTKSEFAVTIRLDSPF
jgi:hypothetical protein